jgi:D-alanine-D-alanine ligase
MRVGVVHTAASPCGCAEAVGRALDALGHEPLLVDSEEIELRAGELAGQCGVVVDHTDTFRGKGLFRPVVRRLLELRGARVVGSDSTACFLTDDKEACRLVLARAGIPVPPGVVLSPGQGLPAWLHPPLVVKATFEHMSRGVGLARTREEAEARVAEMAAVMRQPALVEAYVRGRELGISVLDGPDGPEVLPPAEWALGECELLGEEGKAGRVSGPAIRRADLRPETWRESQALALEAYRVLGLRDYARFDVRLSAEGVPCFLEANTKPSLEEDQALALSAGWAGLDYVGLIERILDSAQRRCGAPPEGTRTVSVSLRAGTLDLAVPPGVHAPPRSSLELARRLDVESGETVLDLGCGSGVLSVAAARCGARRVVAVDVDPGALAATEANARRNGLAAALECRAGSWYEALDEASGGSVERFDVIVATPPQLPAPRPIGPKWGGPDGLRHLRTVVEGAAHHLAPGGGRLWVLHTSLADPPAFGDLLRARFREVEVVGETDREFTAGEYDALAEGLFSYLQGRRAEGRCEFREEGAGRFVFRTRFFRVAGPR